MKGLKRLSTLAAAAGTQGFICDGDWVESKDQDPSGDVRLIQLADIGVGEYLNKSNRRMTMEAARRLRCTFLNPGDILIARMPDPIGRACIFPGDASPCVTVVDVCVLRVDSGVSYAPFVVHNLNAPPFFQQINRFVNGTTRQRISRGSLEALSMLLPSLDEQRRIAEILDQADDLRSRARRAATLLSSLAAALFESIFGDPAINPNHFERVALCDIAEFVGGSQPPKTTFSYAESPTAVRFVQIRDFRSDNFKTYIPKHLAKRLFEKDDIMIGRYGPPVFQIFRGLSGAYNVALMKVKAKAGIRNDFLFYLLKHATVQHFVVANSERTAGQSGVNLDLLNGYQVYRPRVDLQDHFSRCVDAIERQSSPIRQRVQKLDELFASLQQRAFAGMLAPDSAEAKLASFQQETLAPALTQ